MNNFPRMFINNYCNNYCHVHIDIIFDCSEAKVIACFLSNTCMGLGINVISTLEIREEGITFSNAGEPVSLDDSFNMGIVFGMLILDSIIYMLIAWSV